MNTSVRISVRATFNDTLRRFSDLREALAKMAAVADKSGAAVDRLGTRIARNEAELRGYTQAMVTAGVATQRFSGPLEGMINLQRRARVATDQSTAAIARNSAAHTMWDTRMLNTGKRGQWLGSILTYNLTVPIAGGFYLAMKREMQFQQALADLQGTLLDVTDMGANLAARQSEIAHNAETLSKIMIIESNAFGINRVEVAKLVTELGRAGVQGRSLVTDTESILTIMRSFSLGTEEATKALLQLRVTYNLTSTESREALAVLGVAAQTTRADFSSLIAGFVRAGPVAAQMGIDVRHLAAELAVMSQAGFAGGESGNALNFALTRLIKPTPEATRLMAELGIKVNEASYMSLNGAERFELLAKKLTTASDAQVALANAVVFGARQAPKLAAEIATIRNGMSVYTKVLNSTTDSTKNLAYLNEQLALQLKNPNVQFQILRENLSNSVREIVSNATPAILGIARAITGMSQSFAALDPETKKIVTIGLAILALAGPILKIISLFMVFGGLVGKLWTVAASGVTKVLAVAREGAVAQATLQQIAADQQLAAARAGHSAMLTEMAAYSGRMQALHLEMNAAFARNNVALGMALQTQAGIATTAMRTQMTAATAALNTAQAAQTSALAATGAATSRIAMPLLRLITVFGLVIGAVYVFRDQFVGAFEYIARAMGFIAHAIYAALSWLNPWARHSPSLVEYVSTGVDRMIKDFSRLAYVKVVMNGVADTVKKLQAATGAMGSGETGIYKVDKGRGDVAKTGNKGALAAYDQGIAQLVRLYAALADVGKEYARQSVVVAAAKRQLDLANDSLDVAADRLDALKNRQAELNEQMRRLGDPTALRSQAVALDEMARSISQSGNADLAKRFHDQAEGLAAQATEAEKVQAQVDNLSAQIAAQELAVQRLTTARDALAATYDTENTKLQNLKDAYGEIEQAINDVTSAMSGMAQQARGGVGAGAKNGRDIAKTYAAAAAGDFNSPLGKALQNDMGDLDAELRRLQDSAAVNFGWPDGGLNDFFGGLKDAWKEGWSDFGKGDGFNAVFGFGKDWPGWLQVASIIGLAAAGKVIMGRLVALFGAATAFAGGKARSLKALIMGADVAAAGAAGGAAATAGRFGRLGGAVRGAGTALLAFAGTPVGAAVAATAAIAGGAYFAYRAWRDSANENERARRVLLEHVKTVSAGQAALDKLKNTQNAATQLMGEGAEKTSLYSALNRQLTEHMDAVSLKMGVAQINTKLLSDATGISADKIDHYATTLGIDLTGSLSAAGRQLIALNDASNGNLNVMIPLNEAHRVFADRASTAADRASALQAVFEAIVGPAMALDQATDDLQKRLNGVANTAPGASRELQGITDAAIRNRDGLRDVVSEVGNILTIQARNGASNDELRATYEKLRKEVVDNYTAAGFNRKEIERLLKKYGLTSTLIQTIIDKYPHLNTALGNNRLALLVYRDAIDQLNARLKTTGARFSDILGDVTVLNSTKPGSWTNLFDGPQSADPGKMPKRALGGPMGSDWTLVGERGPELIRTGTTAAYVYNNSKTRALMGGGGSTHNDNRKHVEVHLHETRNADPHYIAAQLAFAMRGD